MVWTAPHSPPGNSLPTLYRSTPRPDHVGAPPDSNKKGTVSGPDRAALARRRIALRQAGRNNGLVIGRASRALVNPQGANANGEWTGCKGR